MTDIAELILHFLLHAGIFGKDYSHIKILLINTFGKGADNVRKTSRLNKWYTLRCDKKNLLHHKPSNIIINYDYTTIIKSLKERIWIFLPGAPYFLYCRRILSAISAINSEFVGFPFPLLIVYPKRSSSVSIRPRFQATSMA